MSKIATADTFRQGLADKLHVRPKSNAKVEFTNKFPQIRENSRPMFDTLCEISIIKESTYLASGAESKEYEMQVMVMQGAKMMVERQGYSYEFIQYFLDRYTTEHRRGSVLSALAFEGYQAKGVVEFETYEEYLVKNIKN